MRSMSRFKLLRNVVLPLDAGPIIPRISCWKTLRLMDFKIGVLLWKTEKCSDLIIGASTATLPYENLARNLRIKRYAAKLITSIAMISTVAVLYAFSVERPSFARI